MKKLFLLIALATSISSQSFAVDFEKDEDGAYLLWTENGEPTELLSCIAGKNTQIKAVDVEDHHKYTITVQITPTDLNWLSEAFDAKAILYVLKGKKTIVNDIAALQEYEIATTFSDQAIAFSLSERQGHMQ